MIHARWAFAALAASGLLVAGAANAQEASYAERPPEKLMSAPSKSAEIGVGLGYSQGFGNFQRNVPGNDINDRATAGGELSLEAGYRINPRWLIGVYGGYARFAQATSQEIVGDYTNHGVNAGVQAQFHTRPFSRIDPWIGVGSGYRGFIQDGTGALSSEAIHGWQLARARFGIDFRASTAVALGPVIGADLTMFTAQRTTDSGVTRLDSGTWTVSPWIFAGLAGRFDIVNERTAPKEPAFAKAF